MIRKSIALAGCLFGFFGVAEARALEHPNVLILLADDLGWADVGYHGGAIDTPSIDSLAAEGMQLHRFYTAPICSPTRAALMTGRDPMRLGVAYAVIMPWDNNGIHPSERFISESFRDAGYQTAIIGKWHLGHAQESYLPNRRGFDHFYGHLHTEVGYFPPFANQGGRDFQRNGHTIDDPGYETFLLSREASRWIKARDKSRPFFLYLPFIAPHTPLDAPDDLKKKYADMEDDRKPSRSEQQERTQRIKRLVRQPSARPMYAAVVDAMDQAVGHVLQTLDEEGIAKDTIVLFFSDNGGAVYATGGGYNFPLRGGKGDTFEGGIRVDAVLRWPGKVPAGARLDQVMTVMDVFPTLTRAAGVEPGTHRRFDGIDMWPAIRESREVAHEKTIFFGSETPIYGSFSLTAFDSEWKLVERVEQDQLSSTVTQMLFDIRHDPNETHDLASEHPDVVQALAEEIRDWRALYPISGTRSHLVPPPGWRAPKDWAGYPIPLEELQAVPAPGMPPKGTEKALDWLHGERGRLIYDCESKWWLAGVCLERK